MHSWGEKQITDEFFFWENHIFPIFCLASHWMYVRYKLGQYKEYGTKERHTCTTGHWNKERRSEMHNAKERGMIVPQ